MDFNDASKKAFDFLNKFSASFIQQLTVYQHIECENDMINYEDVFEVLDYYGEVNWIKNGCTKLVVSIKAVPDWVIKIPFLTDATFRESDDEIKEVSTYDFIGASQITKLFGAIGNGKDYCLLESLISDLAIAFGVEDLFAQTYYAFDLYGIPVYLSEKARTVGYPGCCKDKTTINLISTIKDSYDNDIVKSMDNNVCAAILRDYDEDMLKHFFDLCKNVMIEDLHGNNVGINSQGKFCLIDYSGYDE